MAGDRVPQRARDRVCLRCGRLDQLITVATAVRNGRSAGVVRCSVTGRFGYAVPVEASVVHTSALSRALAAPARPRTATAPAIAFGVSGLLALWNLQVAALNPVDGTAWFGVVSFAVMALGSGWVLWARHRHIQTMTPVVDEAIKLWRRSWYCRRCGVVSVYALSGPTVTGVNGFAATLVHLASRRRQAKSQAVRRPASGAT